MYMYPSCWRNIWEILVIVFCPQDKAIWCPMTPQTELREDRRSINRRGRKIPCFLCYCVCIREHSGYMQALPMWLHHARCIFILLVSKESVLRARSLALPRRKESEGSTVIVHFSQMVAIYPYRSRKKWVDACDYYITIPDRFSPYFLKGKMVIKLSVLFCQLSEIGLAVCCRFLSCDRIQ